MSDLLDGATYKVARADEQLRLLREEMRASPRNNYYRGMAEFNEQTREFVLDAVLSDTALLRWGVMTGEIVHNLRSALDLAICALVRANKPTSSCSRCEFPIADEAPPPGAHLHALRVVRIPAAVAVIEAHQPYVAAPNAHLHPLWILNKLNNWDKHRVLQVGFLEFVIPDGATTINFQRTPMKDGATAYHIVVKFPPGMSTVPGPTPVIVFSKPGPTYADPITWRLGVVHAEVKAVLMELAPLLA